MNIEQTFTWFSMKEHKPPDKEGVELLLNIIFYEEKIGKDNAIHRIRKDYVAHGITWGDGLIYSPDRGFYRVDEDCISHWAFFPMPPTFDPVSYIFRIQNRMGDNQCDLTPT